jgi:cholesterol oxidase
MIGTVSAPSLSPHPLTTSSGVFNLFVKETETTRKMIYEMKLNSVEGKTFLFSGFKEIRDDDGFDMWKDTTVLFITVSQTQGTDSLIIGKGKLEIRISDFEKQLTTMKAIHTQKGIEKIEAIAKFGKLFVGNLWDTYVKKTIVT